MDLSVEFDFDKQTFRHRMNGHEMVLHCHHYMSLTTKLAEDWAEIGGIDVLSGATEDSIRPVLDDYIARHGVTDRSERLNVGCGYYSVMGLGRMAVSGTAEGGSVVLERSHVDEGWVKKWGKTDKPVNHVTRGYVAAMFGAAFDRPPRSFSVTETSSIAKGDEKTVFAVEPVSGGAR